MLYVPIMYADTSEPVIGNFPDVNDPAAVAAYIFDPQQMGAEYLHIVVDGQVNELGPDYVVGANTPLASGSDDYIVPAAFLTPLTKGTHTVNIAGRFSGSYIQMYDWYFGAYPLEFEWTYTIVVQ